MTRPQLIREGGNAAVGAHRQPMERRFLTLCLDQELGQAQERRFLTLCLDQEPGAGQTCIS